MKELQELAKIFSDIKDPAVMQKAMLEIFTEKELRDVSLRLKLMKQLKQGQSQREIAATLGISLCKITRGSKILKQDNSFFNKILN